MKSKYISSAFLLLLSSVVVKFIGAVYKIPLTSFIGAVGRGYFATAYNLCMPIHAITMGAFPVALSKLVSKYNAVDDYKMVSALKRGSYRVLLLVGIIGMSVMLLLAVPYSRYIASAPKSVYTIVVLAPSILFSSLCASYRGYFEGFMNMLPTSLSQTIEAVTKMLFGLLFAKLSMAYLYDYFSAIGMSDNESLSAIYPFTSAFAMLGVTFGSFVSLVFLWSYYRINNSSLVKADYTLSKCASREMLAFSLPIMISSAVQSVFQFLDTASVQYSLGNVSSSVLRDAYSSALMLTTVDDNDLTTYLYGLFSSALDFKNLIPGVTMALGICAVPAVSTALECGNNEKLTTLVNSVYKYTVLLSSMGGIALALVSREVLSLFYFSSSPDIVEGATNLVKYFSLSVTAYSLAGSAVFVVQALGMPEKSIASYIVSGVIRVALNIYLISRTHLVLLGAVASGAVGYSVLALWNIVVSGIRLDLKSVVIKPAIVSVISFYISSYIFSNVSMPESLISTIIIKVSIIVVIYCILCFLCGLLKIRQIFCAIKL